MVDVVVAVVMFGVVVVVGVIFIVVGLICVVCWLTVVGCHCIKCDLGSDFLGLEKII